MMNLKPVECPKDKNHPPLRKCREPGVFNCPWCMKVYRGKDFKLLDKKA